MERERERERGRERKREMERSNRNYIRPRQQNLETYVNPREPYFTSDAYFPYGSFYENGLPTPPDEEDFVQQVPVSKAEKKSQFEKVEQRTRSNGEE